MSVNGERRAQGMTPAPDDWPPAHDMTLRHDPMAWDLVSACPPGCPRHRWFASMGWLGSSRMIRLSVAAARTARVRIAAYAASLGIRFDGHFDGRDGVIVVHTGEDPHRHAGADKLAAYIQALNEACEPPGETPTQAALRISAEMGIDPAAPMTPEQHHEFAGRFEAAVPEMRRTLTVRWPPPSAGSTG